MTVPETTTNKNFVFKDRNVSKVSSLAVQYAYVVIKGLKGPGYHSSSWDHTRGGVYLLPSSEQGKEKFLL